MAAKKDKKAIGNLIIAVIPLIGVIWAAVAGIQHNGYVKDVKMAEDNFEVKMAEKLNSLDLTKENNIVIKDLNVTSVIPSFYQTKLRDDKVTTNNSSYTVKISANPTIEVNENDEKYAASFELNYEFFVTADAYSEFLSSYAQGKNVIVGYEDYIYLTYYKDNPRSSVIYALDPLFDEFYANTLFYEYQDEVIYGLSPSLVVEMIDEIPDTLQANKNALNNFNKLLSEIATQYSLLSEEQKAQVTNYDLYNDAKELYAAKSVQLQIDELVDCDSSADYKLSYSNALSDVEKAYNKLSEEQKALVENAAKLQEQAFKLPIFKAEYYVLQCINDNKTDTRIKTGVKFYNELSAEQKAAYNAELLAKLKEFVAEYNEGKADNKKLVIE